MSDRPSVPLLELRNVAVEYGHGARANRVIHDVDLTIATGETVGVLGESGSGKTTLGRAIVGLEPIASGAILFRGDDITRSGVSERRRLARHIQVVFQDPYSSLNPAVEIGRLMQEPLVAAGLAGRDAEHRVGDLLRRVGLPAEAARSYPGAFSGGQRQRIAIARALVSGPALIVCDEPVSALDLSVQAQVLNLLRDLQDEYQLSYLFIGHNIDVVRFMSHRIAVLAGGRIVEVGDAEQVATAPRHDYTRSLLAAVLSPDAAVRDERRRERATRRAS